MGKRNKLLFVLVAILLIANLLFFFSGKGSSNLSFDVELFAVQDTSALAAIQMGDILLEKRGGWQIGQYPADPAFVNHLVNVLMRVRVNKPVGEMPTDGAIPISINKDQTFHFTSNETKTRTYFILEGEGYEMEIPGFTDYVGGIFELEKDQWRDRLVYDGSWRTIQKLNLDYVTSDDDDFTIRFDKDFFKIEGIASIDTATMMNYLNQFQYFQANERISKGRIQAMDSVSQTEPLAVLYLDDINIKKEITFTIYSKRPEDPFHLLLDPTGEMIAVDAPRVASILRKRSDFGALE
ncbi:MAG: hypothetical protein GY816_21740 [Cytophagales bacterium]|nr:hypothetical protein [Cytophagales bacterium]